MKRDALRFGRRNKPTKHRAVKSQRENLLITSSAPDAGGTALANIMRLGRRKIFSLFRRKQHPLPFPPKHDPCSPFIFDARYLHRLNEWLLEEERHKSHHSQSINFRNVKKSLLAIEKEIYGYDFDRSYPSCYFSG